LKRNRNVANFIKSEEAVGQTVINAGDWCTPNDENDFFGLNTTVAVEKQLSAHEYLRGIVFLDHSRKTPCGNTQRFLLRK
jgi:hypothetical protein